MNLLKEKYPDFKWESYRDLNPYLQIIGLKIPKEI